MEVTSITTEPITIKYALTIEHEGEEYLWEVVVDEGHFDDNVYHHTKDGDYILISNPEWLEDEDFFDLLDAADNDPAFSED